MHPHAIDVALVVLVCVVFPLVDDRWLMMRIRRRIAAGAPGARLAGYRAIMTSLWVTTAVLAVGWALAHHSWALLNPPVGWRAVVAVGVCVAAAGFFWVQLRGLRRRLTPERLTPARAEAIRGQLASVDTVAPQTTAELQRFFGVSLTAGVCEEWLYRGVLTTVLATWWGLPIAVVVANLAFGIAHGYQGLAGMLRVVAVGLVMSGTVLVTGSLLPAMLLHAIVDIGGGVTTHAIFEALDRAALPRAPVAAPAG